MLIVSGGLQRTGSTWMWQMLGDIVEVNGGSVAPRNQNVYYWAQEWANSEDTILCKTHTYKSTFENVIDNIKIVMTVRDPRDLVCSFAYLQETTPQKILYDGKFDRLIESWRIWKDKVPPRQLLEVRYEAMYRFPKQVVPTLFHFLETPMIHGLEDEMVKKWSLENNRIRSKQRYDFKGREYVYRRLINQGEIGQFKHGDSGLTLKQIHRIEDVAADYMKEYGYTELGEYDEVSDN